jgi:hypothetical protein
MRIEKDLFHPYESHGRSTPIEFKGISSIYWNRQRLHRRNEISIVTGQRFELHFWQ